MNTKEWQVSTDPELEVFKAGQRYFDECVISAKEFFDKLDALPKKEKGKAYDNYYKSKEFKLAMNFIKDPDQDKLIQTFKEK